jgi:hypothetical protein
VQIEAPGLKPDQRGGGTTNGNPQPNLIIFTKRYYSAVITLKRDLNLRSAYAVVALSITFVTPAIAQPGGHVMGLLSLGRIEGPLCGTPPPVEIALYATPDAAGPIGSIRADRSPASDKECYRAILNVRWRADGRVQRLPTEEYEEEEPLAAIVLERRDRWFKVQVPEGTAWIRASDSDEYFSLQQLLVKRPAYLTDAWDGMLAKAPGGPGRSDIDRQRTYVPVRFVESRVFRGALWLRISLLSHTIYESADPPRVLATGWVPAHDGVGNVVVWFNSRD